MGKIQAGVCVKDLCQCSSALRALSNRYVGFVDDEHFYKCVEKVCGKYAKLGGQTTKDLLLESVADPFKMIFDMGDRGTPPEVWEEADAHRIRDKSLNNSIGEFHQAVLGGVEGWESFSKGHPFGIDLAREDNTMFIELKNKYNTLNGSKKDALRDKLASILRQHPKAKCYWAYILSRDSTSGECEWVYRKSRNPNIRKAWGSMAYGIVTGSPFSLSEMWEALPRAMFDITNKKMPDASISWASEWLKYATGI